MGFEIDTRFQRLEELVTRASERGLDELTASYFCKLGSVLICGNIERCVEIIVLDWLAKKSPQQVSSFFRRYFLRGTNYDCDQILQFLNRLDTGWGLKFDQYLKANSQVDISISSCYAVRNSVAHGGGQSFGPRILRQYFDASFDMITELDSIVR